VNLHTLLKARQAEGKPVTVGLIGAGKFGTMFLAQVQRIPGMHLVAVADLNVEHARRQLESAGWEEMQFATASLDHAFKTGRTFISDDADALIASQVDVIVEATGLPEVGLHHALAAIAYG